MNLRRIRRRCSILLLLFLFTAASISHFLNTLTEFSSCSSNEFRLLCFLSLALALALALARSFFVIHVSVDIKMWSKKDSALLLLLFSV